jgi:hypothetical protein
MRSLFDGITDPVEIDEIASQARSFHETKLFDKTFELLRGIYTDRMAAEPTYNLTAVDAHASLRVLEQVRQELSNAAAIAKRR